MKVLLIAGLILLGGCTLANKIAPAQLDADGNPIPGTHQVSQPIQDTAATIPYGSVALNGVLLVWNFIERARANKNGKGLIATVSAIKQASKDPEIQAAVEKLKGYLATSHKAAGVQPLVDAAIAKV